MQVTEGPIAGLKIITPRIFEDPRGLFFESYRHEAFVEAGILAWFVQDNEAWSASGVLRGLHYQAGSSAQAKLIRVVSGAIYDVVVDLRPTSNQYGEWFGIRLDGTTRQQLFIPRGFAHGYLSLEENTVVQYKCDNVYDKSSEGGVHFDDPVLGIDWRAQMDSDFIVSDKDLALPGFGSHKPVE